MKHIAFIIICAVLLPLVSCQTAPPAAPQSWNTSLFTYEPLPQEEYGRMKQAFAACAKVELYDLRTEKVVEVRTRGGELDKLLAKWEKVSCWFVARPNPHADIQYHPDVARSLRFFDAEDKLLYSVTGWNEPVALMPDKSGKGLIDSFLPPLQP